MVKSSSRYNELTGKEWLQYSFSIWRDIRKTDDERALRHPAMFPFQLASRIIDIYTKKKDTILDPFMGAGSTVLSAYFKHRRGIGIELSKEYIGITHKRLHQIKDAHSDKVLYEPEIYNADARNIEQYLSLNSVDLCLTSPPYWDVLNMKRSADGKKQRSYSDNTTDLGNIADYETFLRELQNIFGKVYDILRPGGHCIVIVMDIRKKSEFYPFHSDVAIRMKSIGYLFEDIIIWDRQHEYNNMKPLGYPYIFRVNKVHEYILIFRKGRGKHERF